MTPAQIDEIEARQRRDSTLMDRGVPSEGVELLFVFNQSLKDVSALLAEVKRLRKRLQDCETSLAIWDVSGSSEYWERYERLRKITGE